MSVANKNLWRDGFAYGRGLARVGQRPEPLGELIPHRYWDLGLVSGWRAENSKQDSPLSDTYNDDVWGAPATEDVVPKATPSLLEVLTKREHEARENVVFLEGVVAKFPEGSDEVGGWMKVLGWAREHSEKCADDLVWYFEQIKQGVREVN